MFESVDARTHARTPARVPSYKLTLWAFGSGELKKKWELRYHYVYYLPLFFQENSTFDNCDGKINDKRDYEQSEEVSGGCWAM